MSQRYRSAVIFDIDGTLADCTHRRHLVDLREMPAEFMGKKNWPEFKKRAALDPVHEPVRKLLLQLQPLNHIVLCTGRDESQRDHTASWLKNNQIPYSAMFMRAELDYRVDAIVKRELLDRIREIYDPWLVVDDRDSVVAMWREAGLTCLQCAPGDF